MSSTTLQIKDAFKDSVFSSASDVLAITSNTSYCDLLEDSEIEIKDYYEEGEVNFFQCLVSKWSQRVMTGGLLNTFSVRVSYFKQKGTTEDGWISVNDALSTVLESTITGLGYTWAGLVDYWTWEESIPEVTETEIAGVPVWVATTTFQGFQMGIA